MPSGFTITTFSDEELLKYQKLVALVAAIDARFLAGLGSADIAWPLTAEGNLDMSDYNILNGKKIWNFVNADNYSTLTEAISAAAGGVVLVPPDTTITTSGGEVITGSGATIIGSGPSSVIKFSASPSDDMISLAAGSGLMCCNLTLDGNGSATPTHSGLIIPGSTDVLVDHVWFKNFSGAALMIGAAANRVSVSNCWFIGGSAQHVKVIGCPVFNMSNIISSDAGSEGVLIESASGAISATLHGVKIQSAAGVGLKATGNNAPGTTSPVDFTGSDISIISNTGGNAMELGSATNSLQRVVLNGGRIYAPSAGGLLVNASAGSIGGITIEEPVSFGIDLDLSQFVTVNDCVLKSSLSTPIGVDGSGTTAECIVTDNIITGFTTKVVTGGTDFSEYNNGSVSSNAHVSVYTDLDDYAVSNLNNPLTVSAFTIPADELRAGDVIDFNLVFESTFLSATGTAANGLVLKIGGVSVASGTIEGQEISSIAGRISVVSSSSIKVSFVGNTSISTNISKLEYSLISSGLDFTADSAVEAYISPATNVSGYLRETSMTITHSGA